MTRIVSTLLLLVLALGASNELAWAESMQEVAVETNGLDLPLTPEAEEIESSDEVVLTAHSSAELASPHAPRGAESRLNSVSDLPPTRPPRG